MDEPATNAANEKQARLLTMALEVFRRKFVDSIAFQFANRDRQSRSPDWVKDSLPQSQPNHPPQSQPISPPPVSSPKPPLPVAPPVAPPVVSPPPVVTPPPVVSPPPIVPPPLVPPPPVVAPPPSPPVAPPPPKQTSATPAFDRPQSVIIVGPRPLPVTFDKALAAPATTPRADRESSGSSSSMAKAIAARFLAVLGPLYALSTILNQTNSGMGVFQKAVSVMGATLAPILLPVFAILASALLSLSDFIWAKILPALGEFYDWVLKVLIPFAVKKGEAVASAVEGGLTLKQILTQSPSATANQFKKDPGKMADGLMGFMRQLDPTPMTGAIMDIFGKPSQIAKKASGAPEPSGTPGKKDEPSFGQRMSANMRDVIKSLSISMGPKGTYSSLGEVGKQATLAAVNADPIEMKAAMRVMESIQEFQKAFERYAAKEEPKGQINRRPAGANDLIGRGLFNRGA